MKSKTWCLIGLLTALTFIVFLKGCDQEHSGDRIVAPEGTQIQKVVLQIAQAPRPTAKALRLKLEAVGIDDQGAAIGPVIAPVIMNNPVFPCSLKLTLFKPPCRYRLTISADLTREPSRAWQDVINICEPQTGGIMIDVFEEFLVGDLNITAPESVNAGDPVDVSCAARQIDAPDRDLYPLTLSLSEQAGRTVSSSAQKETTSLADAFADPFALTSPETQRLFTCTLADGRSASQVVQKTVARILPTPTPTATSTSTPMPTSTPTKTPVSPKPTATPTPNPCVVQNTNDSGTGSLRQVLTDAPTKGCSTITFTTGVSTIRLNSQLAITSGSVTIDGGTAGVAIGGGFITRVFYVNRATVNLENLTIINGAADCGGGIFNQYGTVTIENSTMITASRAASGGGICCAVGTVTINGTVSDNAADVDGGGIYNEVGTVTINGTVIDNTANGNGGGVENRGGTVTVNKKGTVSENTANGNGGGINNREFTLGVGPMVKGAIIVNGTISGNRANYGGGVFVSFGTADFQPGNLIQNNTATTAGGGIANSGTLTGTPNYGSGNTPDNCAGAGCL